MNPDIEEIRNQIKKKQKKNYKKSNFSKFLNKFLITIVLTLITLITLRSNKSLKTKFYQYIYEKNISFASINAWYEKQFGSSIPFKDIAKKQTKEVFDEKLTYQSSKKYKDGVELTVNSNYLVPILESGMVVYIGEKEGYGKTVIIQQVDGTDVWYGNINNESVKLYDYVEKGKLLGEVKDKKLYLVFKKDGKALPYEEHI